MAFALSSDGPGALWTSDLLPYAGEGVAARWRTTRCWEPTQGAFLNNRWRDDLDTSLRFALPTSEWRRRGTGHRGLHRTAHLHFRSGGLEGIRPRWPFLTNRGGGG